MEMRHCDTYELEEMGENMENLIEHVNSMSSSLMPRDFLARILRHFFKQHGEEKTYFQIIHLESCLELEQAFPDMRKRKLSANALPYTVFKLIQKEVEEAQDETATKYFVEAFCDRQTVFDNIVKELESTVVLEKQMFAISPDSYLKIF